MAEDCCWVPRKGLLKADPFPLVRRKERKMDSEYRLASLKEHKKVAPCL